jgi:SAM-dependent methyltransferase
VKSRPSQVGRDKTELDGGRLAFTAGIPYGVAETFAYDHGRAMNLQCYCRLCGRVGKTIFSTRDCKRSYDRTEYAVAWCKECDLGRVAADFTPQEAIKFFDIPYYTHEAQRQANEVERRTALDRIIVHLAWRADKSLHFSPAELGSANGRSICDIGCGNGDQLVRFREAGFATVGVEPDPVARTTAAKRLGEVFDGTLEILPEQVLARKFDVVFISHVLDACCDFKAGLTNVRSILGPGGILIAEVPNCASKGFRRYGADWPWVDIPRHQAFFTDKSLRRAVQSSGLDAQKIAYLGYTRQFSPAWKSRNRSPLLWLASTAFASDKSKYDSLRIYATRSV